MDSTVIHKKKWASRELQMEVNNLGLITVVTSNCLNILGYSENEIINTNVTNYIDFNFNELVNSKELITEVLKKDRTKSYFDIAITSIQYDKNIITNIDLSFIEANKYKELEEREKMFFKIFENSKDIVCKFEVLPEPKFAYLSQSVEEILGYAVEEHMKNPNLVFEIVHPEDYEAQLSKINPNTDFSQLFELRYKHKDGHYLWLQDHIIPTFNENGELIAVHSISRNIQKRKELEAKLERLSFTDGLTGLYNRAYLNKQIKFFSESHDIPIGIIVCDLDHLKYVNDTLGHHTRDLLIQDVSSFFLDTFSKDHIIVRNGGDEFLILMLNISLKDAEKMYSKMLNLIEVCNKTNTMPIELSSGFSYSSSSKNILEHLNRADKNMYKNKYERRNKCRK